MEQIKFFLKYLVYIFLHLLCVLPIKKQKLYFTSFHGARFSCNPKYLYKYIIEHFRDNYVYIWEFQDASKSILVPDAKTVKYHSFKSLIELMTSHYIITNNDLSWWIPLRKKQILLQTWHGGGAYKKVGINENWGSIFIKEQLLISKNINFYVSSSLKFTEVQAPSKNVPTEKFITTGMPRNTIFFDKAIMTDLRNKVYNSYGINEKKKIILFAPTFRGTPIWKNSTTKREYGILDFEKLKSVVDNRFEKEFVILYRAHHVDSLQNNSLPSFVIDATHYEDMQELLCAADILITDYSSTMWDYALTKRPCFLFAPDLNQYIADRGFYTNPYSWPFSIALNEEELWKNIMNFDSNKFNIAVQKHLDDFGSYENIDSCNKICNIIGISEKERG